ncbi:MAG: hypothetical protein IPK79_13380 [Vampirovibrionales bacterium]|nr:hypothetical protein [Vampirovibrionales bacterium]
MTPEQWLAKHYPVPASELAQASDEECLMHCMNKWEGAKQENIPEGMTYEDHCISSYDGDGLVFDTDTCALCEKYLYGYACKDMNGDHCPIFRMQGHRCCWPLVDSVYSKSENDPSPMIGLLQRTLEFVRNGG